jgi:mannose/fructose/N-acetylgalactosamine-specific phosphotransferase system component IIC
MSPWVLWSCAVAACALIELDNAAVGQFMISRPMILGPALGLILEQPVLGAGLGALCELLCLEELPVGGSLPLNAAVAVSVALLLAASPAPAAPELAFPVGLSAGWAHARLESFLRRRRGRLNALVEGRLAAGQDPGLGALALCQLAAQAAATLGVIVAALALGAVLRQFWPRAPLQLRSGLRFGFGVSPWIGLWSLARSFKVVS